MKTIELKRKLLCGTKVFALAGALSLALAGTATADTYLPGTRCIGRGFAATYSQMRVINQTNATQGVICPMGNPAGYYNVEVKVRDASTTGAVTCTVQAGSFFDPGHWTAVTKSTGVDSLSPSSLTTLRWTESEIPRLSTVTISSTQYHISCTLPPASSNGSSYIEAIRFDQ
jgi:hypothetical protein